jgi:hypothetical protein
MTSEGRTHSPDEHVWQPNGFDAEECSCGATRLADGTVVEWQPGGAPTPEQAYAEGRSSSPEQGPSDERVQSDDEWAVCFPDCAFRRPDGSECDDCRAAAADGDAAMQALDAGHEEFPHDE